MKYLSNPHREIVLSTEGLRNRQYIRDVFPNINRITLNEGLIGIHARHERSTGWTAQRVLAVCVLKQHPPGCQSIDVRCPHLGMTVRT